MNVKKYDGKIYIELAEGEDSIEEYSFRNEKNLLGELILPDNLERIGAGAFEGCSGLVGDLIIPNSVKDIGEGAFKDCTGLNGRLSLSIGLKIIRTRVFSGCISLNGNIEIPSGVKNIEAEAFYGCHSFKGRVSFPDGLKTIGDNAFRNCNGLTGELKFPSALREIGKDAFRNCSGFTGELFLSGVTNIGSGAFANCYGLTGDIEIPDGVVYVEKNTFSGCTHLDGAIVFPRSLRIIEERSFYGCINLHGPLFLPDGVKKIGSEAFRDCRNLTGNLYIPEKIRHIEANTFRGCNALSGILHLPGNLLTIDTAAFEGCINLKSRLGIPDTVIEIGERAFKDCTELYGQLNLPDKLRQIGRRAFENCGKLEGRLDLPVRLSRIGVGVFNGCPNILVRSVCPKRILNNEQAVDYEPGIDRTDFNNDDSVLGIYYVKVLDAHIHRVRKANQGNKKGAYLSIPATYAYEYNVKKGNLYFLKDNNKDEYVVLKAAGNQSKNDYAKQFEGNGYEELINEWYDAHNAKEGDYVITTIMCDQEIFFSYISQTNEKIKEKYKLKGRSGKVIIGKAESVNPITGFRLVSFEVKDKDNTIVQYFFLPEDIRGIAEEPVTTLIIGENGVGKSFVMKLLSEVILSLQNESNRNNLLYSYYKLKYILNGKIIIAEIINKEIAVHVNDVLVGERTNEITADILPGKVLALSVMLQDKFVYREEKEKDVYKYLGPRETSNAAFVGAFDNKITDNIIWLASNSRLGNVFQRISEFIEFENRFCISIIVDNKYVPKEVSFESIKTNLVEEIRPLKESRDYRGSYAKKIDSTEENILSEQLYKILKKDSKYRQCQSGEYEIIYDKDYDPAEELSWETLQKLKTLRVLQDIRLYFYKKNSRYALNEVSSGEKQILYVVLNIARYLEENSLVLIDEPEISLHPNWQMMYISFLKKVFCNYGSCHFILTTHAPYLVSDLDPSSSSLITIIDNEGKKEAQLVKYDTYAWSVENILYNVFHVRTARNYYFEKDLEKLIRMIQNNHEHDSEYMKLVNKLSSYTLDDNDPLLNLLRKAKSE